MMTTHLPTVTPPRRPLPPGACDAHAHVFGPYARFPLGEVRSYTPPEATADDHQAMLDVLSFQRAVIVQPTAYGDDNRCIMDAVARDPGRRRAIGVATGEASADSLAALAAGGVAGLRFVELISQRYAGRPKGSSGFADLQRLAPVMRAYGIHAQLFAKTETYAEWMPRLLALGLPLVLDHMAAAGAPTVAADDPLFDAVLGPLREGRIWVKLAVIRHSANPPLYADARPFHDAFMAANGDRLLWGTDWPLVNMENPPDPGRLIDLFDAWTPDETARRKVFVDNPLALYGFTA
ncbi:metal-dependent hydrolase [Sphingobium indicum]|uniref:Metal-dependent hydrolase n=1 Tax=Sphingobium indicum TaxID=332055 RepID=A0A4Q4IZQ0_9SPHN|nr:amidohydrolase family protein [Sphingobium indicum]KEY99567.1 metal-dependent hydrolase [Sphingomonas sp. BHC-A]NYI24089.1 putative TIM-barrel fold metal-dependent hydrolase [Sphingobium indicum]RYL99195.1 metal-dependent hydrolase [Sphingobium indicum]